jgi:hypothetical protein
LVAAYFVVRLDAPTLNVFTIDGYRPDLEVIAAFACSP